MARQTKKILKKIKPKEKNSEAKKPEKVGKDYLLIFILSRLGKFTERDARTLCGDGNFSFRNLREQAF